MTFEEFTSAPPSTAISFEAVEELESVNRASGLDCEYRQIEGGAFNSKFAFSEHSGIGFFWERFGTSTQIRFANSPGMATLVFPVVGAAGATLIGEKMTGDEMVFIPPGAEVDSVATGLCGDNLMMLPLSLLDKVASSLTPEESTSLFTQPTVVRGDTQQGGNLSQAVAELVATPSGAGANSRAAEVIDMAILWMTAATSHRQPERLLGNHFRRCIAKRARDYLEDHFRDAIRMEQACADLKVGARTLQRCFLEYFDTSPSAYLKRLRLNRARRDLLNADRKNDSVTMIALENGFSHLGRFSLDFRAQFGESPGEVLRRG